MQMAHLYFIGSVKIVLVTDIMATVGILMRQKRFLIEIPILNIMSVSEVKVCPTCGGFGKIDILTTRLSRCQKVKYPCDTCGGSGIIK